MHISHCGRSNVNIIWNISHLSVRCIEWVRRTFRKYPFLTRHLYRKCCEVGFILGTSGCQPKDNSGKVGEDLSQRVFLVVMIIRTIILIDACRLLSCFKQLLSQICLRQNLRMFCLQFLQMKMDSNAVWHFWWLCPPTHTFLNCNLRERPPLSFIVIYWQLLLLTKEYDADDIDGDNEEDVSGNVGENLSHIKEGFWWRERVLSLELG